MFGKTNIQFQQDRWTDKHKKNQSIVFSHLNVMSNGIEMPKKEGLRIGRH